MPLQPSANSNQTAITTFRLDVGIDLQKAAEHLQVGRAVQAQILGSERTTAGPEVGTDPQGQQELIGQIGSYRNFSRHIVAGLTQGLHRHFFGPHADLTEAGEYFG